MKIYHKFLLYQNKLLKPYIRIILGLVEALTYLASLTLIVGVIYEHGFPLSVDEIAKIQVLYKAVWIIFLIRMPSEYGVFRHIRNRHGSHLK